MSVALAVCVSGLTWYADRGGEIYALPAETLVGPEAVAAAAAGARFSGLRLPGGRFAISRRRLPLTPVPLERVFPLGAAEVPWSPPHAGGVADLGRAWQGLLRERDAFAPWGREDRELLRFALRRLAPRSTFHARPDGGELDVLFPQLAPPDLVHRLGPGYLTLADRGAFDDVAAEAHAFQLEPAGRRAPKLTASLSRRPSGAWQVRCGDAEAVAPDAAAALTEVLAPRAGVWRLLPPANESSLLVVPR